MHREQRGVEYRERQQERPGAFVAALSQDSRLLGRSRRSIRHPARGMVTESDFFRFRVPIVAHGPGARDFGMTDGSDDLSPADVQPAAELLPRLYAELRRLATALAAQRGPGESLTPTALVHEAYLRLVKSEDPGWQGPRHFFGAAARAMREILIEQARYKGRLKRGGGGHRVELTEDMAWIEPPAGDILALDEAIGKLQQEDAHLAEVVMLRYYSGLTVEETARVLDVSISTVTRDWRYARAWLAGFLGKANESDETEAAHG